MGLLRDMETELASARQAVAADNAEWEALGTGQDTEQAEYSGYLGGYRDGIKFGLDALAKHGWVSSIV